MYLDEEDALRPASAKSAGSSRAMLIGGVALIVVLAAVAFAVVGGEDHPVAEGAPDASDPAAASEPAIAPRSEGQLAAPEAVPPAPAAAIAPAPAAPVVEAAKPAAPTPKAAPTPVAPAAPAVARTESHSTRPSTPAASKATEEDLLQQLTERAGEFAATKAPAPQPVAPELEEPAVREPVPQIVPEFHDDEAP